MRTRLRLAERTWDASDEQAADEAGEEEQV